MSRLLSDGMAIMGKTPLGSPPQTAAKTDGQPGATDLERAFLVFVEASQQLEDAYEELQQRVQGLTDELAVANGELRRQYAEKAALSQRLQTLLEALPAGVVEIDGAGVVQALNATAGLMFGPDICGQPWCDVRLRQIEATFNPAEWGLRITGERRVVNLVDSELPDGSGRIVLIHDVTAAHRLQQQLEHHKRLSALGEMAAVLAHQLRTPLAAALLYVANLQRSGVRGEDVQRFAEKALGRLRHLEKLVQDMLRFVRGQGSGQLEPVDLADLVADAAVSIEPELQRAQLRLELDVNGADCSVQADRQALQSALVALLENAVQASPEQSGIRLAVRRNGDVAEISVCDSGAGIAPDLQARLFEPFFTTRSHGTGLGLAIVKNVVEAVGGRVKISSQPGNGAEFILVLPVSGAPSIVS